MAPAHVPAAAAELKSELFDLAAAERRGAIDLVDHIYKAHPPKKAGAEKPDMSPDNMVKGLRTAISHYHPVKRPGMLSCCSARSAGACMVSSTSNGC